MSERPERAPADTDASVEPPDPMIGVVLDERYKLKKKLGQGGMGLVYVARQMRLERLVAVKIVHSEFSSDPALRARFEREAVALAQINHPHVLHAYDHGITADGRLYLVTELLSGRPLHRLIAGAPSGLLPLMPVVVILRQLASALEAVHGSLVHRDLKPHNVIVDSLETGVQAKLLDFGIVRPNSGSQLTSTGIIGTPAYMSPEQVRQDSDIDARSDLYSLGIMAYELLAGAPPFLSERHIEVLMAHLERPPPPLPAERAGEVIPAPLANLVMGLLEKDRHARPGSAAEVKTALKKIETMLHGLPSLSPELEAAVAPLRFTPFPNTPHPAPHRSGAPHPPTAPDSGRDGVMLRAPRRRAPWLALGAATAGMLALGAYTALTVAPAPLVTPLPPPLDPEPLAIGADSSSEAAPEPNNAASEEPETSKVAEAAIVEPTAAAEPRRTKRPRPPRRPAAEAPPPKTAPAEPAQETQPSPAPSPNGFAIVSGRTVTGEQPFIEVLLDGKVIGKGARVRVELPPGKVTLGVRRVGSRDIRNRTVQVRRGEQTLARVLLD